MNDEGQVVVWDNNDNKHKWSIFERM